LPDIVPRETFQQATARQKSFENLTKSVNLKQLMPQVPERARKRAITLDSVLNTFRKTQQGSSRAFQIIGANRTQTNSIKAIFPFNLEWSLAGIPHKKP